MPPWRNWQTRTFEVRVVYPWGFESPPSHQKASRFLTCLFFYEQKWWNGRHAGFRHQFLVSEGSSPFFCITWKTAWILENPVFMRFFVFAACQILSNTNRYLHLLAIRKSAKSLQALQGKSAWIAFEMTRIAPWMCWQAFLRNGIMLLGIVSVYAGTDTQRLYTFCKKLCTTLWHKAFGRTYCEGVWLRGSRGELTLWRTNEKIYCS